MNKSLFIGLASTLILILQGFFAAPALAQYYQPQYSQNYQQSYTQSYTPGYQQYPYYYNYPYNNYSQYPYNNYSQYTYNNGYSYNNCGYYYPYYCNYNYNYNNNYYYGPLTLTGVSGPTQLSVGQGGTWTVGVRDSSGHLSYSAVWGDEGTYGYSAASAISTSGTLSHSYLRAGTYTPRFTVTNGYGQTITGSITVVVAGGCNYYYPWTCQSGGYPNYPYSPYGY